MKKRLQSHVYYFLIPVFVVTAVALILQSYLPISGDVGYLLHVTEQLFHGGKYGDAIFETNPPMILYLYSPAYWVAKTFSLDLFWTFRLYVALLAILSISTSFALLKKIIQPADYVIRYALLYVMLFALFILPVNQFGQREHFLLILMLPYLFSTVIFLENKSLKPVVRILIGLFAGLGFALKPFFLAALLLVEFFVVLNKRKIGALFRLETLTIVVVFVAYLSAIVIFQPDYFKIILPLVSHFYFTGVISTWIDIFSDFNVLFCMATCGLYFIFKGKSYKILRTVLMLATIGMLLAFIIPRTPWYYHMIPAIGLACLLLTCYVTEMLLPIQSNRHLILLIAMMAIVLTVPLQTTGVALRNFIGEKKYGALPHMVKYFNALPGNHSMMCFSATTPADCFPLVNLIGGTYASRYPFFWWIRGLRKIENNAGKSKLTDAFYQQKNYLINKLVDDMNQGKIQIIIINKAHAEYLFGKNASFSDYFSSNKAFVAAWKQYRYVTTIDYYQIYTRIQG